MPLCVVSSYIDPSHINHVACLGQWSISRSDARTGFKKEHICARLLVMLPSYKVWPRLLESCGTALGQHQSTKHVNAREWNLPPPNVSLWHTIIVGCLFLRNSRRRRNSENQVEVAVEVCEYVVRPVPFVEKTIPSMSQTLKIKFSSF